MYQLHRVCDFHFGNVADQIDRPPTFTYFPTSKQVASLLQFTSRSVLCSAAWCANYRPRGVVCMFISQPTGFAIKYAPYNCTHENMWLGLMHCTHHIHREKWRNGPSDAVSGVLGQQPSKSVWNVKTLLGMCGARCATPVRISDHASTPTASIVICSCGNVRSESSGSPTARRWCAPTRRCSTYPVRSARTPSAPPTT